MRRTSRLAVSLAATLLLTGCGGLLGGGGNGTPSSPAASAPVPTGGPTAAASPDDLPSFSAGPVPSDPTPTATPTGRPERPIEGSMHVRGRYATASWDVEVPTFEQHPAAPEANRRIRAAVDQVIAGVKKATADDAGAARRLTGTGRVTTNDGRTVQVQIDYSDNLDGTAHPTYSSTSTVIDVRRIKPVLLTDIVQNPPEGLRYLRSEVVKVAKSKGEVVDQRGLAPKVANWACWQSTPTGLRFCFQDYQLGGHGLRAYTVPWPSARLVLSDYGERLLVPR